MEIYVKISLIFIFFSFFWFSITILSHTVHWFTRIAASNTATDDITTKVTHRIFNANLQYSFAHLILKIGEKNLAFLTVLNTT